jgi:hypothetical protein
MQADARQVARPAAGVRGGGLMRVLYVFTLLLIAVGLVFAIVVGALGQ